MSSPSQASERVAVLIPCYQEEQTSGWVVTDFKRVLPQASVYVFDNNCTDATARIAQEAGAIVRREKRQGKGHVVASMFEQIDADILIMVDGDDTYDADSVFRLLEPLRRGDADMTVATRLSAHGDQSFRQFHLWGNRTVCAITNWMFGAQITDVFSGYRAFTQEAASRIPITASGFDVETELTLQALYRGLVIKEVPAPYRARPEGSFSKLRTVSDGLLVLLRLFLMIRSYRPLTFFGGLGLLLILAALLTGFRPVYEYATERFVYSVPRAVLAAALAILSFSSLGFGLILNSVNLRLLEMEKLICRSSRRRDDSRR